jgi:serine/threonine protein kinase/tetratricopeptide (TPR) repeat protein
MDTQQLDEKAVFNAARRIADATSRDNYLVHACGDDLPAINRIRELLRIHEQDQSFLESPPPGLEAAATIPVATEQPGTVIGSYKLLEQIGEGGMGVVFMAEQERPVHRKVALKIVKPGMDTRQVIARFEAERQALAMMDHPNIAKVFDAGATETGRPFFVMELVQGVPITDYCDQSNLTTRERIELFITVCHAVQHAHQKGVIHRDIKPTNVLVAIQDGRPAPKIIDFGVAKAINQLLMEDALATGLAQMIGTPMYMSPEQAELSPLGVDTRSDIYSLGVLLYELLTGTTPFDKDRMQAATYDELRRMIREEEPAQPSARISTLAADLATTVAERRRIDRRRLLQIVRGDLDWIVMKCLDKDRNRRYESASSLAADIVRYLNDEPVTAGPPSAAYRLRKFLRRNKGPVLAACATLLVLICGVIGTTWGMIRAGEQRRLSELSAQKAIDSAHAEKVAKLVAQSRAAETKAALDFVENQIFAAARPAGIDGGLGRDVSLRQAIEAALPFVEKSFPDQPLIEARLRTTLGASFLSLGEPDIAVEQFEAAGRLYTANVGPDHEDTLASMSNLASGYGQMGRYAEAVELHRETLERHKARFGPDHLRTLHSTHALAGVLLDQSKLVEARALAEQVLETRKRVLGAEHRETLQSMNLLGNVLYAQGRWNDARQLREDVLKLSTQLLGPDHPDTLWAMNSLGTLLLSMGDMKRAGELHEHVWARRKAVLGLSHPDTLVAMYNLALVRSDEARLPEARQLLEDALQLQNTALGPKHLLTLQTSYSLALALKRQGDHQQSRDRLEECLALCLEALGADHRHTMSVMSALGSALANEGKFAEARQLYEDGLARLTTSLGPEHPTTLGAMHNLAHVLDQQGERAQSEALIRKTVALKQRILGPAHAGTLSSITALADLLRREGQPAEARQLLDAAFAELEDQLGAEHPTTLAALLTLGAVAAAEGDHKRACEIYQKVVDGRTRLFGPDHLDTLDATNNLAGAYLDLGRHDDALELIQKVHSARVGAQGAEHPSTLTALHNVGTILMRMGQADPQRLAEARQTFELVIELRQRALGPEHPELLESMKFLAHACALEGNLKRAREITENVLATRRRVLRPDHPAIIASLHDLFVLLIRQEDFLEARKVCEEMLESLNRTVGPEHPNTLQAKYLLAQALNAVGSFVLSETGTLAERESVYRQGLELLRPLVERFPDQTDYRDQFSQLSNNVALCLIIEPSAEPARVKEALELLTRATELQPHEGMYWSTLSLAHYRAGDWKAALDAEQESISRTDGGDSIDWFILAMTHWQRGEKDQAKVWYDRAITETEDDSAASLLLRRLRDEASALVGNENR